MDVVLSSSSLTMEPSFISLLSHRSLKVRNLSPQPVTYTWKSYKHAVDEEEERDRLLYEINRMESMERATISEKNKASYDYPMGEDEDITEYGGGDDEVTVGEKFLLRN